MAKVFLIAVFTLSSVVGVMENKKAVEREERLEALKAEYTRLIFKRLPPEARVTDLHFLVECQDEGVSDKEFFTEQRITKMRRLLEGK